MNDNAEKLELLSIFHYVLAGIVFLLSFLPMLNILMYPLLLSCCPEVHTKREAHLLFGAFFIILPITIIIPEWIFAVCLFIAGRKLAKRKSRNYCLVIACIECLFLPLGTVLGVFTIIILMKDGVKALYIDGHSDRKPG